MQASALARLGDDILLGQVRALQETFEPRAHAALLHWGSWSRNHGGLAAGGDKPHVKSSSIYRDVMPDPLPEARATAYIMDTALATKPCNDPSVVQDPDESDDHADLRLGEQVDLLVHIVTFADDWRRILRAIYVDRLPHWQWCKDAKVKPHRFTAELSTALKFISDKLP